MNRIAIHVAIDNFLRAQFALENMLDDVLTSVWCGLVQFLD